MTDTDENLLTAAKLFEQTRGDLDGGAQLHDHAGLVEDQDHRGNLSFLKSMDVPDSLLQEVEKNLATETAANALAEGQTMRLSHLVGVTEQQLDGSSIRLANQINSQLENNAAPAFVLGAGNPNTGKTNLMVLLAEIRKAASDDLVVLSNVRSLELTDHVVTSAQDLTKTLIELRDTPKFVLIDEGSTHFDARTYRREIAQQFTPLAKRFAKLDVDVFGAIGHTGKDIHPEVKRLSTLSFYKSEKTEVEFFDQWPADADFPVDRLFGGSVESLEPAAAEYDPDDAAPWAWDLEPELFAKDLDWREMKKILRD